MLGLTKSAEIGIRSGKLTKKRSSRLRLSADPMSWRRPRRHAEVYIVSLEF
jgi:hypothetical protein